MLIVSPALELLDRVGALGRGEAIDVERLDADLRAAARRTAAAHELAIGIRTAIRPLAADARAMAASDVDSDSARAALEQARDASVRLDEALRSIVEAAGRFDANDASGVAIPDPIAIGYAELARAVRDHAVTAREMRPELDDLLAAVIELESALGMVPDA